MRRWVKWGLGVLAAIIVLPFITIHTYDFLNTQFAPKHIIMEWPVEDPVLVEPERYVELHHIVDQPYIYLDRGKQAFAFASQDGKYVLKFFDARRLRKWFSLRKFPSERSLEKKRKNLLNGYRIAYRDDRDHNGILFLQLSPDKRNREKVSVRDRFGFSYVIDLGDVPFVIQKKAVPTRTVLTQLLNKGKVEEAKEKLGMIAQLYFDGYQHGLYDLDHNFIYNTGFVDGQAIRIDVGRLRYDLSFQESEIWFPDAYKVLVLRLHDWLGRHFPRYQQELSSYMQQLLSYELEFDIADISKSTYPHL